MTDRQSKTPIMKLLKDQRVLLAIVIVAIVVIISLINPKFVAIGNIVSIFQQICVLGILTMAMSILLISGGIDLSIGNIMVLSGVVMYLCINSALPLPITILAGRIVGIFTVNGCFRRGFVWNTQITEDDLRELVLSRFNVDTGYVLNAFIQLCFWIILK